MNDTFDDLFPTHNPVDAIGSIKQRAEDFRVFEINDINWTEQGEHWWLYVEKINSNTLWVAKQIAKACQVPNKQVGYAGLKDRHALTRQWFSVQLPAIREMEALQQLLPDEVRILDTHWHQSKLKTGYLQHNHFKLTIRNITGNLDAVNNNIKTIQHHGVPNYFGPQRFGHQLENITQVQAWFAGEIKVKNRKLRSLLISAARSHVFNLILAHRIEQHTWHQAINGDLLMLDGTRSWFPAEQATSSEIKQRLADQDIHLTAALWGEDEVQSTLDCASMEQAIAAQFPLYLEGFKQHRVRQDRRSVRIVPKQLTYDWQDNDLVMTFDLPPGAYATSVLREVLQIRT